MNTGFVYVRSRLSPDEVKKLLEELATEESYYFVRSPHAVSGICRKLPDEFSLGFEGQMFNSDRELRWKKQGSVYEALILSRVPADLEGFEAIGENWECCDRAAYFHSLDEPKFPKTFIYKGKNDEKIESNDISIGQRYFQDQRTATVHFVALTVRSKK
ncbi:MAG: hypothetical protein JGK30_23995 [Microcoleus sp. PH2017_40_RAT_O_B]|uniref:hypothetical protein n=1 Tax=unclassified Microcoleus TaxID=2642155 RepID=UPI001D26466C|nr:MULTISPECIES: hypothetical protein [unclassified Microcoleus]TAF97003.1 MAG: hypothetical protein EAZ45_22665 [Oscillatoriales cyanobacterium]MCC3438169.1 hypothetical protein [Microcoleus sp. PH2017_05_CCC_O_A]MCC3574842.1 hypothetical protein [Microcoleus sp. PH2017_34_RAT_O_A]MCC3612453.1 hypothetical protein [Microcoleus sp. PH2017_40_RAT_O_B]TAG19152.1 MAG: hypothetical protein EAZ39_10025 [Oscillatoriales cyanobacterium]